MLCRTNPSFRIVRAYTNTVSCFLQTLLTCFFKVCLYHQWTRLYNSIFHANTFSGGFGGKSLFDVNFLIISGQILNNSGWIVPKYQRIKSGVDCGIRLL